MVTGGALGPIAGTGLTRTATFTPTSNTNNGVASISVASGTFQDAFGNSGSAGTTPAISFDTLVPGAPSTADLVDASDSGNSSNDNVTNANTPTFSGNAESGSVVTLYGTDGTTVLGSTIATGGVWTITSTPLTSGAHTISAKATDAAGNVSQASAGLSIVVDAVVPSISGAISAQNTSDQGPLSPFASIVIADTGTPSQIQTVSVSLDSAAKGVLSNLGGGTYDATTGIYRIVGAPADVTATLRALIYTPAVNRIAPGLTETSTFTVVVTDAAGNSISNTSTTVIATSANDAPTLATPLAATYTDTSSGDSFAANTGTLVGSDVDVGQTLTYSITGGATANGTSTLAGNFGTLSVNRSTGAYTYTPNAAAINALAQDGLDTFTVSVDDGNGGIASASFTVNLTATNDTPSVAGAVPAQSTLQDQPWSLVIPADTFADADSGDTQTFSATLANGDALPAWLSFNPSTRTFSGTPDFAGVGTLSIAVRVTDSSGATASASFALTVGAVAPPPSPESVNTPVALPANVVVVLPSSEAQNVQPESLPAPTPTLELRTNISTSEGVQQNSSSVDATLTSRGASAFQITVLRSEQPALMLFKGVPDQNFNAQGGLVTFTIPADAFAHTRSDAVVQLSARMSNGEALPNWLVFDAVTGKFTGQVPAGLKGVLRVSIVARDSEGREASTIFQINLEASDVVSQQSAEIIDRPAQDKPVLKVGAHGRTSLAEQLKMAHKHRAMGERASSSRA